MILIVKYLQYTLMLMERRNLMNLEEKVTRLLDITEIQQVLNRYVYMLTTMDFEHIFDVCFAQNREDVSIQASDSGVYIGKEHVRDRFFGKFMGMLKTVPGAFTMHFTTNPVIEIAEDGQKARSVCPSPGCATDPQHKDALWIWGTFIDDYIKEDGHWKILHHAFVPFFRTPYDKGWTKQAIGTQLSKISNGMNDGPSEFWNPYDMAKSGDELFCTLPTVESLKEMDF